MADEETLRHPPNLDELRAMAANQDWEAVDSVIGLVSNSPAALSWAQGGLDDEDGNLRDLAASLLEASDTELSARVIESLLRHVKHDENPAVSYRSAFALYRAGNRSSEVIRKLHEALADEDVADIAKGYLGLS